MTEQQKLNISLALFVVLALASLFFCVYAIFTQDFTKSDLQFVKVGDYNGCDVVRVDVNGRYHYMSFCGKGENSNEP